MLQQQYFLGLLIFVIVVGLFTAGCQRQHTMNLGDGTQSGMAGSGASTGRGARSMGTASSGSAVDAPGFSAAGEDGHIIISINHGEFVFAIPVGGAIENFLFDGNTISIGGVHSDTSNRRAADADKLRAWEPIFERLAEAQIAGDQASAEVAVKALEAFIQVMSLPKSF